jgi:hypothetical protein
MPPTALDRAAIVRANTGRNVARARLLRRQLAKAGPAHPMTWGRVWWVLPVTGILDILRLLFVFLIFTAPIILGTGAAALASLSAWTNWIPSWMIAAAAGGSAGALEILQPEIAAAVEGFGLIMAMVIGLFGFILIAFFLVKLRVKLSGANALRLFLIFVGGVTPFADGIPSLTPITFRILHDQIKEDRKAVAAHKAEQAKLQAQLRQVEMADRQEQLQLRAGMQQQAQEQEAAEAALQEQTADAAAEQGAGNADRHPPEKQYAEPDFKNTQGTGASFAQEERLPFRPRERPARAPLANTPSI